MSSKKKSIIATDTAAAMLSQMTAATTVPPLQLEPEIMTEAEQEEIRKIRAAGQPKPSRRGRRKSKGETRSRRMVSLVKPSLYRQLEELADKRGESINETINEMIKKAVKKGDI